MSEHADLGPVLVGRDEIQAKVVELGAQISADYSGLDLLLVGVLKGAFVFVADLVRAISADVAVDFIACSSHGSSTRRSGVVRILKDLDQEIEGRHVLLVDEIVDSGLTLGYLRKLLSAREPASLETCALLVRETMDRMDVSALKYWGFRIPGDWVVGYGLDAGERWRQLPDVRAWLAPGSG